MATLVVQTSFLGDVVLTTPLIAALGRRGPVDVLTTAPGAQVLANNPEIRNTIVYDKRDRDRGIRAFMRIVGQLRQNRYDAAYLAQGSFRSGALVVAAGIPTRVGFDTSAARMLYTNRVQYRADKHHAERLWSLGFTDCADPPVGDQTMPRVFPGEDDRRSVDALLGKIGTQQFVALGPGSAWGTKRWPFYPELAAKIVADFHIVVIGGKSDVEAGNLILAQLPPGRGLNAAGQLSLLGSAEIIGRATALVSNDSAPQHFASAMGTPTITIFGPTTEAFGFGPLAPGSESIGHPDLPCRPCHRHGPARCPLGHWRCMRELSSDVVHEILLRMISTSKKA
ncbi:MAG TPA: lipopolysaccharide heptosyltransferase II [Gemmatimonadaceae bacterium]|nr:lipopolysaccharide heptosyltransferase II [Gemmatimonadaceae bacterium]